MSDRYFELIERQRARDLERFIAGQEKDLMSRLANTGFEVTDVEIKDGHENLKYLTATIINNPDYTHLTIEYIVQYRTTSNAKFRKPYLKVFALNKDNKHITIKKN